MMQMKDIRSPILPPSAAAGNNNNLSDDESLLDADEDSIVNTSNTTNNRNTRIAASNNSPTTSHHTNIHNNTINNNNNSDNVTPAASILYIPGGVLPKLNRYMNNIIEIRIPSKYLSSRNREVHSRQLWGSDIYTDDSDTVAIVAHSGEIILRIQPPTNYAGLSAYLRVLPGRSNYLSAERYNLRSRSWSPQYHRCSLQLLRTEQIDTAALQPKTKINPSTNNNNTNNTGSVSASTPPTVPAVSTGAVLSGSNLSLAYFPNAANAANSAAAANNSTNTANTTANTTNQSVQSNSSNNNNNTSKIPGRDNPLIKMLIIERAPLKSIKPVNKRKFSPDFTVLYNSFNEPCLKYCLTLVGDRGMDETEWTSTKLRTEAIYLEAGNNRYELAKEPDNNISNNTNTAADIKYDKYRWSLVLPSEGLDINNIDSINNNNPSSAASAAAVTTAGSVSASKRGRPSAASVSAAVTAQPHQQQSTTVSTLTSIVPARSSSVKVIDRDIDWDSIEWGPNSVRIKSKEYPVQTIQFKKYTNLNTTANSSTINTTSSVL